MNTLKLTADDNASIDAVVADILPTVSTIEDPALVAQARVLAQRLPLRLRSFLEDHRLNEPSAVCLVSGLDLDPNTAGPTPQHWRDSHLNSPTLRYEIFFLLASSLLGDVFAWSTQQDGRIMHDVLPIAGHEDFELGSNSRQYLSWHTEDSFHPCRGDYVALMCIKNPDDVMTDVCDAASLDWSSLDVEALAEPIFTQMPDNSHQPNLARNTSDDPRIQHLRERSYRLIEQWNLSPEPRGIVFGDLESPYMALDPYHMKTEGWPERNRAAYEQLRAEIDAHMIGIALQAGDCIFVDNFRAVHGRRSFTARYDGNDRWLKRLNITRDLRKSRAWRVTPGDRTLY